MEIKIFTFIVKMKYTYTRERKIQDKISQQLIVLYTVMSKVYSCIYFLATYVLICEIVAMLQRLLV